MESKKDIGNYFKENLEQLDYSPSNKVWDGIEAELKKKKKRRFLFWIFFAAIAILGFSTYSFFNNPNSGKPSVNTVVTTDSTNAGNSDSKEAETNNPNPNNTNSGKSYLHNTNEKENNRVKAGELVNDENSKNEKNNWNGKSNSGVKSKADNIGLNSSVSKMKPHNGFGVSGKSDKSAANFSEKEKISSSKKGSNLKKTESSLIAKNTKHSKKRKKSNGSKSKETNSNNADFDALKATASTSDKEKNSNINDLKKEETNIALASEKSKKQNLDDLKKANQQKRDSLVAKKDAEKDKTVTIFMYPKEKKDSVPVLSYDKFDLDVFVSPTYYGSFSKKSPLDTRLDSLTKKSEIKYSYGVGLTYELSKKLSMRIGYSKINISYTTQNAPIDTINYSGVRYNTNISNHSIYNDSEMGGKMDITQKISYTEIPLEFKYKFLDKKIGLKSSLGFSYLILSQNTVSIKTSYGRKEDIGKTYGLSKSTISFNLGAEVDYPIFKNMKLFVEPMFNYQTKAYSRGDFKAYYFGVHTGLRYSFNK